ncbi:MAG: hypothetical protein ABIV48_13120 [Pyrinomonadaceae bacterium]
MTRNKLGLAAIVLFLTIAGAAVAWQKAMAQNQDKIEYNTVYVCGDRRAKFKVLSCKGTGKLDTCEVFNINELSPNGGYQSSVYFNIIEDTYIKRYGCKTKNSPAVRNETEKNESSEDETPVRVETDGIIACSASSEDSDGKTANEKTFRGVIRRLWEKEARKGSDGAVTITFQKVIVGAPRAWRANLSDAYSQADPKKPIYPVRATFATCTDYKKAVSKRKMERIYDCFVHKTGGWQCTQTGASGALALKDKEEYIQKQQ